MQFLRGCYFGNSAVQSIRFETNKHLPQTKTNQNMSENTNEKPPVPLPAWLQPPTIQPQAKPAAPPSERRSQTARVMAESGQGCFRLAAHKKFSREEWSEIMAMFKARPELKLKSGFPHPDRAGIFFIQYNRRFTGGEYWGTKQRLSDYRKQSAAAAKRHHKNKMESNPEYRAKVHERLKRVVERSAATEEERLQKKREASKRWQAANNSDGKYSRAYYLANKMRIAKARKAKRKERWEAAGCPPDGRSITLPKPESKRLTKERKRELNAARYIAKKAARLAKKAALSEVGI
jgi:hypothetical protein